MSEEALLLEKYFKAKVKDIRKIPGWIESDTVIGDFHKEGYGLLWIKPMDKYIGEIYEFRFDEYDKVTSKHKIFKIKDGAWSWLEEWLEFLPEKEPKGKRKMYYFLETSTKNG